MLKMMGMALVSMCLMMPAQAADDLVWTWEKPRRFLLISDVNSPEYLLWQAEFNYQARVFKWRTNIVASCVPADVGKKTALVNCHIEDISLQATSLPGDMKNLPKVLEDLDAKLSGASIQLEVSMDGRVRSIDLEGIDKKRRRLTEIVETMRLVLARAIAPLDLQMPKKGSDGGTGAWIQKQTLVTGFPSGLGTMGQVKTQHQIMSEDGETIKIQSSGNGIAGSGRMVEVNGQEQVANFYEMQHAGEAVFDRADGSLLSREYQVRGVPTASSEMGDAWSGMPYLQYAKLVRLGKDEKPNVGESRVLAPASAPKTGD